MTDSIRTLTGDDLQAWKAMRLEAISAHPYAFGSSYEEESPRTDEEWLYALLLGTLFGYFSDGKLIAMAGFYIHKGMKRKHRATVFNIYVQEAYRGKDVIDKILSTLCAHARTHGVEQLQLDVGIDNATAIACYKRNGFEVHGTSPRALKWQDTYIDEHLMVKYL